MHYSGAVRDTFSIFEGFFEQFNTAHKRNEFDNEAFVGHAGQAMRFFVVAVCKSEVIDFVAAAADAFGKRDISILDQPIKFFVVEFVVFVKRTNISIIDDPNAFVDGIFDPVSGRPATTPCIENTESKDEAKSET
jgi:hypothetical protein